MAEDLFDESSIRSSFVAVATRLGLTWGNTNYTVVIASLDTQCGMLATATCRYRKAMHNAARM